MMQLRGNNKVIFKLTFNPFTFGNVLLLAVHYSATFLPSFRKAKPESAGETKKKENFFPLRITHGHEWLFVIAAAFSKKKQERKDFCQSGYAYLIYV